MDIGVQKSGDMVLQGYKNSGDVDIGHTKTCGCGYMGYKKVGMQDIEENKNVGSGEKKSKSVKKLQNFVPSNNLEFLKLK